MRALLENADRHDRAVPDAVLGEHPVAGLQLLQVLGAVANGLDGQP
jgi:hypothetical protein